MCERWVGDWTETATYWPPVPPSLAALLCKPRLSSWAALPGVLKAQIFAGSWFSMPRTATTDSKLTESVCGTGSYNCLMSPASCERRIYTQFNPSTVKVIHWYLRPDAPVPWSTASCLTVGKIRYLSIFTDPSAGAGYDRRSIFKFNGFEFIVFLFLD